MAVNLLGNPAERLLRDLLRDPDLRALWTLNEKSGTLYDRVMATRANSVSVAGSPGYGRPIRQYTSARQFTAANSEYFTIADNTTLSMGNIDMSGEVWVYLDTTPTAGNVMGILGKWTAASKEYRLYVYNNGGVIRFVLDVRATDDGSETAVDSDTFGAPATGTWYRVKWYHDSVTNLIGIGVNDGAFDTAAHTGGVRDAAVAFDIGRTDAGNYLNGRLGPWKIWKRILTTAEWSTLYRGGGWAYSHLQAKAAISTYTNGLVEACDMDAASGDETGDFAALTFTDTNTVTTNPGVILPTPYDFYGLHFDGVDDAVSCGDVDGLDFDWKDPFSLLVLLNPHSTGVIFSKLASGKGWQLWLDSGRLPAMSIQNSATANIYTNATTALTFGTPALIGVSVSGSGAAPGVIHYKEGAADTDSDISDDLAAPITNTGVVSIGAQNVASSFIKADIGLIAVFAGVKSAADFKRWAAIGRYL